VPTNSVKLANIKFHENPFSHSQVAECRQADKQHYANSAFLKLLVLDMPKKKSISANTNSSL
jgi:hypothetical protein